MRPIHELSNEEKAELLHNLMPHDIGGLITHLEQYALTVIKNSVEMEKDLEATGIKVAVESWVILAHDVATVIKDQRQALVADPDAFASELFSGYRGVLTVYYLQSYCAICTYRFSYAIRFPFDLKPAVKPPFGDQSPTE